ncbi:unnamed protein product [Lymnaea stagnalis]|uniref:Uncharacterized protein n=1 Tax=Lymnaea stagnalis TaxID=6523 RepID=A0AAV2HKG7_LYMST
MAVLAPTEEDNDDEDEFLDDNDPPIHVNPINEPPRDRALADLGVHLRPRPWVNISDDVSCLQPHLECGAQAPAPQAQQMLITETQLGTSLQHCCKAIGSSESRGESHLVKTQCLAPELKARLMPKKKADASNGNDAEQLLQENTRKVPSTQAALSFEKEAGTRPRWTDKELHPISPISDPVDGNEPRVNLPAAKGATSAENYSYFTETNSDQAITAAASGCDDINQPPTSQKLFTSDPNNPPPQNKPTSNHLQHPNINSQASPSRSVKPPKHPVDSTTRSHEQSLSLQDQEHHYEKPKDPEYATPAKRLDTFRGWPPDVPVTEENLVKSGLYYEGDGDQVRCFHCGGAIKRWEPGDDPDVEHARWYPNCGYIRQYKGQAFVDTVRIIKNELSHGRQITLTQVEAAMNRFEAAESNGIALSSDVIMKQLTEEHNTTDETNGAMATSGAIEIGTKKEPSD